MYSILQLAFHIISGAPVYLLRTVIAFVKVRASPMLLIYWRVSEAAISSKHFPQVTNYLKSSVLPLTVLRSGMATGGKGERRLWSYAWGNLQLLQLTSGPTGSWQGNSWETKPMARITQILIEASFSHNLQLII